MALLIHCEKCGQDHLQGMECRPENIKNKENWELQRRLFELERRIENLEKN
jgi:hypothetical protein